MKVTLISIQYSSVAYLPAFKDHSPMMGAYLPTLVGDSWDPILEISKAGRNICGRLALPRLHLDRNNNRESNLDAEFRDFFGRALMEYIELRRRDAITDGQEYGDGGLKST